MSDLSHFSDIYCSRGGQTCFLLIRETSFFLFRLFSAKREETDNFTPVRPLGMSLALNALSPGQHLHSLVLLLSSSADVCSREGREMYITKPLLFTSLTRGILYTHQKHRFHESFEMSLFPSSRIRLHIYALRSPKRRLKINHSLLMFPIVIGRYI